MAPSRAISSDADSVDALIVRRVLRARAECVEERFERGPVQRVAGELFDFGAGLRQRPDKTLLQRDARQRMFLPALRIGRQEIVEAGLPLRRVVGIRVLGQAARKYVASEARAATNASAAARIASRRRSRNCNAPASSSAAGSSSFLRSRQQKPGLQISQPSGHHEIIRRKLKAKAARGFDKFEILLGERQHGNFLQVYFLSPREIEKQVERPLEPVDIDDEGAAMPGFVGLQLKFKFQRGRSRGLIRSSHRA